MQKLLKMNYSDMLHGFDLFWTAEWTQSILKQISIISESVFNNDYVMVDVG